MSVPRFWRFNRKRYMLTGAQCTHCGERFLAPRLVCPQCHSEIEQVARDVFPTLAVASLDLNQVRATYAVNPLRDSEQSGQ